jgi:hypothetical protein
MTIPARRASISAIMASNLKHISPVIVPVTIEFTGLTSLLKIIVIVRLYNN